MVKNTGDQSHLANINQKAPIYRTPSPPEKKRIGCIIVHSTLLSIQTDFASLHTSLSPIKKIISAWDDVTLTEEGGFNNWRLSILEHPYLHPLHFRITESINLVINPDFTQLEQKMGIKTNFILKRWSQSTLRLVKEFNVGVLYH